MRRVIALALLTVAVLLHASGPSQAQELYVVTEDKAPYNTVVNGEIVGYSTEIARAVFKRAKVGYHIEVLPWARAYRIARSARDVLIYTIAHTPERADMFHWIGPIAPRLVDFYRLAERTDLAPASDKDLLAYTTGAERDDVSELMVRRLGFTEGKNMFVARDLEHLLRLLDAGRIDFFPANPHIMRSVLERTGRDLKDYVSCYTAKAGKGYFLGVSRGSNVYMVERLRRAFEELKKDGTLKAIAARYDEYLLPKTP